MEHSSRQIICLQDTKTSLKKFKIENISSIFFRPQWYEIRDQLEEANQKIHKYVEIKQVTEPSVGQQRNQDKLKNTFTQMKMETHHTKTSGKQLKQF